LVPLTNEQTRRNVIRQWISGLPRDTIAAENNIGAGTVSSIIASYKVGLEELDFNLIRQLAVEARQHGLNLSELASHFRLYNYFLKSGASENTIESFITKVSTTDVSPEQTIELVYQLYEISRGETIPLHQVPGYIGEKLQEKQKIDEQIKEADATLQSKNVSIEAINEHIHLKEELKKYRLSTKDIHRLVNLLEAAKEYRYSPGKIVAKLRSIKGLENKENKLKTSCDVLSKQADKYKGIIPLAQLIWDLHISKNELISFKIAVNEAVETYGLTPSAAALHVINLIKDHNKKGQLKKELSSLYLQKYAINEFCSRHSQTIMALMNLQSHGIIEEQIISLNNFLESNGYKTSSYTSTK
jgi:vacuolar-type H+-ATPase subunit I/STV1